MALLTDLDLRDNSFTFIKNDTFLGLSSLLTLNLEYNKISIIDYNSLEPLTSLVKLDLSDNSLIKIDCLYLYGLTQMVSLDLNNNFIQKICPNSLEYELLERIDLSNNELKLIDETTFTGELHELKYLYLQNNLLESIEANSFVQLIRLEQIDLSNNLVQTVDNRTFNGLKNLKYLVKASFFF